jgi:hypothetical protein
VSCPDGVFVHNLTPAQLSQLGKYGAIVKKDTVDGIHELTFPAGTNLVKIAQKISGDLGIFYEVPARGGGKFGVGSADPVRPSSTASARAAGVMATSWVPSPFST